jgi:UDP-N-acetyl-D-galactosamine dehydrogenase
MISFKEGLPSTIIGVLGLGYVGLPLAVEFGKKRKVIGFDVKASRIQELIEGYDSTLEVSRADLASASRFLSFSDNPQDLRNCGVFIVTVPTPIDGANRPDLSPLIKASETVGHALQRGAIVIYESTVYPGCTEEICVPILEKHSRLVFNRDFFVGYSPERINPGDKVNTLTKIRKITSGSTLEAADFVDGLYREIIDAGTFRATSIKVAEAAKVIENTQRDLNIALVNELSVIFDRLAIDTIEVLEAAGSKWNFLPFRPGMVGGHCIGVDPYYLTHKAEQVGYNPQVILAGRRINDEMARYAARRMVQEMLRNGLNVARSVVGVMGITFKENCPDIRNSKVADLITELQSWNVEVVVYDPWADPVEVLQEYGIRLASEEQFVELDSLIVAVGHSQFRDATLAGLRARCKSGGRAVLADLKALFPREKAEEVGFSVFRF